MRRPTDRKVDIACPRRAEVQACRTLLKRAGEWEGQTDGQTDGCRTVSVQLLELAAVKCHKRLDQQHNATNHSVNQSFRRTISQLENKLPSIKDRAQTDHISVLAHSDPITLTLALTLDLDLDL